MRRVSQHGTPEGYFRYHMGAVRRTRRMSQEDLAGQVGIGRSALSEVENGRRCISLDEAVAIAAVLDVPLLDMLSPNPLFIRVPVQ